MLCRTRRHLGRVLLGPAVDDLFPSKAFPLTEASFPQPRIEVHRQVHQLGKVLSGRAGALKVRADDPGRAARGAACRRRRLRLPAPAVVQRDVNLAPVSYTHLTLPTIY